jgi:hypothetical protein
VLFCKFLNLTFDVIFFAALRPFDWLRAGQAQGVFLRWLSGIEANIIT